MRKKKIRIIYISHPCPLIQHTSADQFQSREDDSNKPIGAWTSKTPRSLSDYYKNSGLSFRNLIATKEKGAVKPLL